MAFVHTRDFYLNLTCDVETGRPADFHLNRAASARLCPGKCEAALVKLQFPCPPYTFSPAEELWVTATYEDGTHTTVNMPAGVHVNKDWGMNRILSDALLPISDKCGLAIHGFTYTSALSAKLYLMHVEENQTQDHKLVKLEMAKSAAELLEIAHDPGKPTTTYLRPSQESKPTWVPPNTSRYSWNGETTYASTGTYGVGHGWVGIRKSNEASLKFRWIFGPVAPDNLTALFYCYRKNLIRVQADFLQNQTYDAATAPLRNQPDQATLAWLSWTVAEPEMELRVMNRGYTFPKGVPVTWKTSQRTYHLCDPGADLSNVRLELKDSMDLHLELLPCDTPLTALVHFKRCILME